MANKAIDLRMIDAAWRFYIEDPSPRSVAARCKEAGIEVSESTISRWVNHGLQSKGVISFKERLRTIRAAAAVVISEPPPTKTKETQVDVIGELNLIEIEMGVARLEEWRRQTDMTLIHTQAGCAKVLDCLLGCDPEDHGAVKNATAAWRNMIQAMKGAVEIHEILGGIPGSKGEASEDEALRQFFEGWTPDEHAAFRDRGVWPEDKGDPPRCITAGTEDDEP